MGSLFANLKAVKCGLPDIGEVGLLLASKDSGKTLSPCGGSFIEVDGSYALGSWWQISWSRSS
jgi:hypothetical protein